MEDFRSHLYYQVKLGRSGQYVQIRDIPTYYEVYGEGDPLLLLHGGLSSLHTFRYQIPLLAKYFTLYLPERPGNGCTQDEEGPYSYPQMAEDTLTFIRELGIKKPHVIGYSDGANLVFDIFKKDPDLIGKFISLGGNFHKDGCDPEFQKEISEIEPKSLLQNPDRIFEKYSPESIEKLPSIFERTRRLWLEGPLHKAVDFQPVKNECLFMAGENDVITLEHTIEMYDAFQNGYLSIIPETTHSLIKEKPDLVNQIMLDFLLNK